MLQICETRLTLLCYFIERPFILFCMASEESRIEITVLANSVMIAAPSVTLFC
jgi:hypothetical protein